MAIQVAEMLLGRGLASIVRHRTDEERSAHYEALLEAEQVMSLQAQIGSPAATDTPLACSVQASLPSLLHRNSLARQLLQTVSSVQ